MSRPPDLREIPELPDEIKQAALDGHLVLFVGAGTSRMLGYPSWGGLASLALKELCSAGFINHSEFDQLQRGLDPKKQLSIAELIAEENGTQLDLVKHLKPRSSEKGIYEFLNSIGCACVTTNYDELLIPQNLPLKDGSATAAEVNRIFNKNQFLAHHLNKPGTVVHLHGSVSDAKSMVVTTKDYLNHYDSEEVQHFLGELFDKKTILFIGYGLEEAEILEHILRRGKVEKQGGIRKRFSLQGFFRSEQPLYERISRYYAASFGVNIIGFVRDHRDYEQQNSIIKSWAEVIRVNPPALTEDLKYMDEVLNDS
jgi:hypothetical protein